MVRKPHRPRFVRLSNEDSVALMGPGVTLDPWMVITASRFVARQRVAMIGPRGRIDGVAVVGPLVEQTQVSIAAHDAERLGLDGAVGPEGAHGVLLVGPAGEVRVLVQPGA